MRANSHRSTFSAQKIANLSPAMAVISILFALQPALSGELVEYLPGYDGKLPFRLETGYISVEESELFYYFIESEGNPAKDPLYLWLTGGPGCSTFHDVVYLLGPLEFNITNYGGGLPTLNYYPYGGTKFANILFLDYPIGSGFSYSTSSDGWATSDTKSSKQVYQFFLKWLNENPKYLPLQTYIGGDSYAGIIVPLVTKMIVQGLYAQVHPRVNLKGYILGSPTTDEFINENSKFIFAHRMGLIPDDVYETAKVSCKENYVAVDPHNTACVLAVAEFKKCTKDLFVNNILEPNCVFSSPRQISNKRSLEDTSEGFILSPPRVDEHWCRLFNYVLSVNYLNDPHVREALHVREGTISRWMDCNLTIDYVEDVQSVIDVHEYLMTQRLDVLINSGDRDIIVPFVATVQWIKALNLTVDEKWRPWFVEGQVAGYTERYYTTADGYHLVFAMVKGAGHTAPEYQRKRCFHMLDRFAHGYPL